jgi:hypothetical protein
VNVRLVGEDPLVRLLPSSYPGGESRAASLPIRRASRFESGGLPAPALLGCCRLNSGKFFFRPLVSRLPAGRTGDRPRPQATSVHMPQKVFAGVRRLRSRLWQSPLFPGSARNSASFVRFSPNQNPPNLAELMFPEVFHNYATPTGGSWGVGAQKPPDLAEPANTEVSPQNGPFGR